MRSYTTISRLLGALVLLCAGTARANTWAASFEEGRAASYLSASPTRAPAVLVVAAGHAHALEAATLALKKSLTGTARLVLDGQSLGAIADLDDAAIVQRAAQVPVEVVLIVRVFGGEHGRDTVVATFYPKKGPALTAFSVEAGAALPSYAMESTGGGVSARVISAVLNNRGTTPDDRSPAQVRYDGRFVGFYETQPLPSGADSFERACPYQGAARTPLCGPSFYEAVDRPDLALASRRRVTTRKALIASGAIALVVGTAVSLGGGLAGYSSSNLVSGDHGDPNYPALGTGLGLVGFGVVGVIVGSVLRKQPTEPIEMYSLARTHNRVLRTQVGLTNTGPDPVPAP